MESVCVQKNLWKSETFELKYNTKYVKCVVHVKRTMERQRLHVALHEQASEKNNIKLQASEKIINITVDSILCTLPACIKIVIELW